MNTRLGLVAAIGLSMLAFFAACHDASARQFRLLYSFCAQTNCADGQLPVSGLIADGEGNLYGTALLGGTGAGGVVFELVRGKQGNWLYQVLYNFCSQQNCADGVEPRAGLIMDTAGNLFGTTAGYSVLYTHYASTIFELSPDTNHAHWTLTTLHSFCRPKRHGGNTCNLQHYNAAISALTYAGQVSGTPYDGKSPLFGYGGSRYAHGSVEFVYRYSPNKRRSTVVHILRTWNLTGDPLLGNNGTLYGTMNSGGRYGQGVVFAVDVTTGAETVLHDFCAQPQCSDGGEPLGGLTLDTAGNLYGNAFGGSPTPYCQEAGFSACGIVYRLAPENGEYEYSILHNLCGKPNCSDGAYPEYSLIMDTTGTLYGVAQGGGGNAGTGTVFEANDDTLRAIHHFCGEANCSDGEYPNGPLLMDAKGNLFGTTSEGGANFNLPNVYGGTIFEITN